jgi:hypothetical protein
MTFSPTAVQAVSSHSPRNKQPHARKASVLVIRCGPLIRVKSVRSLRWIVTRMG